MRFLELSASLLALALPFAASAAPKDGCTALVSRIVEAQIAAQPVPTEPPGWLDRVMGTKKDGARAAAESAPAPAAAGLAAGDAPAKSAAGPRSHSRTNTQEADVDEGDLVKTDGRAVYHLSCSKGGAESGCRDELRVYASFPASQSRLLSRTKLPGGEAKQMYLLGDRVAVIQGGARTRLTVLDVRDARAPRATRTIELDGAFVDSRAIGERVTLATRAPYPAPPPALHSEIASLIGALGGRPSVEAVMARLDPGWIEGLERSGLPRVSADGESRSAYGCRELDVADGPGGELINVVSIELSRGEIRGAGATGHSAQSVVYASESAFYLADPTQPPAGTPWQSATLVRKFALGAGGPSFAARGVVRGNVHNSFSLSEHAGDLRVATSDGWAQSGLYVLRERGGALAPVGALEGLAPNERIYAVRMMGDRGYVVTFRRTDPLFVLDLSDATRPTVVGELKVEGWSSYLHPLGDHHLLAVGQDADAGGRPTGFHLQVFDVSDPRRPVRKFHRPLDAASMSSAESDHHAFLFEPETMTLSMPWKGENYFGLVAFKVDPVEGFVELGRVNHALMYKQFFQGECAKSSAAECASSNRWYDFVTRQAIDVDRVVAIEDQLYSLSPAGLMVHRVSGRLSLTTSVLVDVPSWRARTAPALLTTSGSSPFRW